MIYGETFLWLQHGTSAAVIANEIELSSWAVYHLRGNHNVTLYENAWENKVLFVRLALRLIINNSSTVL